MLDPCFEAVGGSPAEGHGPRVVAGQPLKETSRPMVAGAGQQVEAPGTQDEVAGGCGRQPGQ